MQKRRHDCELMSLEWMSCNLLFSLLWENLNSLASIFSSVMIWSFFEKGCWVYLSVSKRCWRHVWRNTWAPQILPIFQWGFVQCCLQQWTMCLEVYLPGIRIDRGYEKLLVEVQNSLDLSTTPDFSHPSEQDARIEVENSVPSSFVLCAWKGTAWWEITVFLYIHCKVNRGWKGLEFQWSHIRLWL